MKRAAVVGIAVGAAALIAGAGVVIWSTTRPPSIESAAGTYLDALADGDFASIGAMLPGDQADVDVLEAAFAGATARIADVEFEIAADDSVHADVTIAGEAAIVAFDLVQRDGRWVLAGDFLATLDVSTSIGDSVRVGDALVPAGVVELLPAEYPVAAAPTGLLDGDAAVVVANGTAAKVGVEASVSPDATALAQEQLDAYATSCAEAGTSVPDHCGIAVPWGADLASLERIAFRVERLPAIQLAADGRSFGATGGVVVATAHGTTRDGAAGSFTYRADDWALRGTVGFAGDEMVLTVR